MHNPAPRRLLQSAIMTALCCFLYACGGGDSSSQDPANAIATGTFRDSPTKGLSYTAQPSGITGTTNEAGEFKYKSGDTVSFALPLGNGNILQLGNFMPVGSNAVVSVLSLPKATIVAQILQSLDHSNSSSHLDVSGLILSATDFDNIKSYLTTKQLPESKTAEEMLASAQNNSGSQMPFTHPGGVNAEVAFANAKNYLDNLIKTDKSQTNTLLIDKVILHTGYSNYGPIAEIIWFDPEYPQFFIGSARSDNDGSADIWKHHTTWGRNSFRFDSGAGYLRFAGNEISGITAFSYYPAPITYDSEAATMQGSGNYRVLKEADFRQVSGKLVTISGLKGCPNDGPVTFAFSSINTDWTAYCGTQDQILKSYYPFPSVATGYINTFHGYPPLARLVGDCGITQVLGVLDGSLSVGSTLAVITQPTKKRAFGRIETPVISAIGDAPSRLLMPGTYGCHTEFGTDLSEH